jgi:ureidoglycolate dehydrogenase (NAD+)
MSGERVSRSSTFVGGEELARFVGDALRAVGSSTADAAAVAEGLVWANLRGVDGHGVSRLPSYLAMIERGGIDLKARPRLVQERGATFLLDGGGGFGPVAMMQAIGIATESARKSGICFGLVRDTTHTGAIGRYVQWIAERGCAALIMVAGPAFVAYHGARVASMGTSPIAIAVPSGVGAIVLDMATSTISNGKILQALAAGADLPAGAALTAAGEPTTDPRRAEILLPLGGPKGSGLALMFEMLASVLAGAPIQAPALGPQKRRRLAQNCAILAIDIETFRTLADFTDDAEALAAILKALPRQDGVEEILLPGERAARTEAKRRASGIPIPGKVWEELAAIAKTYGVALPSPLSAKA